MKRYIHKGHCFLNSQNKPVALKRDFPEFDKTLKELMSQAE